MIYKFIITIRSSILVYLTHKLALPVLKLVRKPELFPFSENELLNFPHGCLGNDLVVFLKRKGLPLLTYYARHDIKHILLDYDTTDEGEVSLQCFMMGNGHFSFPVIATVLYGLFTMPEHWKAFSKAFKRGRKCSSIANWKWFDILHCPTQQLKSLIN